MITRPFPKINGLYKRDAQNKLIIGDFCREEYAYLKDNLWHFTEKVDGMNMRVEFGYETLEEPVCGVKFGMDATLHPKVAFYGKTDNASIPGRLLERMKLQFSPEVLAGIFPEPGIRVTLYGEGYGAGIQKGAGYFQSPHIQDFILFDVRVGDWWLKYDDVVDIASKLCIRVVPFVGVGTIEEAEDAVRRRPLSWIPGSAIQSEGLVIRPMTPLCDRSGNRIIAKVKVKDYL